MACGATRSDLKTWIAAERGERPLAEVECDDAFVFHGLVLEAPDTMVCPRCQQAEGAVAIVDASEAERLGSYFKKFWKGDATEEQGT